MLSVGLSLSVRRSQIVPCVTPRCSAPSDWSGQWSDAHLPSVRRSQIVPHVTPCCSAPSDWSGQWSDAHLPSVRRSPLARTRVRRRTLLNGPTLPLLSVRRSLLSVFSSLFLTPCFYVLTLKVFNICAQCVSILQTFSRVFKEIL
jgi:hypothetical protein